MFPTLTLNQFFSGMTKNGFLTFIYILILYIFHLFWLT